MDGVSKAKSNSISLDIYSIKIKKCRTIYPIKIVRPILKGYINNKNQLRNVLNDLSTTLVTLDEVVADAPKRANLRDCLNFMAKYTCDYCYARGVPCKNQNTRKKPKEELEQKITFLENNNGDKDTIELLKKALLTLKNERKGTFTSWPATTNNQEERTRESMLEIIEKINTLPKEELTPDVVKGVVGRSLFLDVENFNFSRGFPTEYMHLCCLGVVKRLVELTFNVGVNRHRETKRQLSSTKEFNLEMKKLKVVREFSRRAREMDFAVYKAEEFRNLLIFYFPLVIECIEQDAKERHLWLYLAFIIRACVIPEDHFEHVSVQLIMQMCNKFYVLYEQLFGLPNCTYSVHVLCCHLMAIRELGPLTSTSAFPFE